MNENKRMLVFFLSVALAVALILVIAFWPEADKSFTCGVKGDKNYSKLGSVNYKQYQCLYKQKSKVALVVSDGLNNSEKKALNKAATKSNKAIYYLSDEISNTDLKTIKKNLKTDKVSYKNSSLVILENKKVTYGLEGDLDDSNKVYDKLKEAGFAKFACNATSDSEYSNLSKLTYEQYQCLAESDEVFTLIVTQSTCSYCKQFKPIIDEYAGDNNIPVYYLDIDTLSNDDSQSFMSSLSYFNDNSDWGTPLTLAIKDKKVVAELSGYTDDTSKLDEFFKTAGLK